VKPSPATHATYLFCLVQAPSAPSLRGVPPGLPGAGRVRLLALGDRLWAAVADAPLDRFSGPAIEEELSDLEALSRIALAHATVIEFFFERFPVVPLKLLTMFSSDESVIAHVAKRRRRLTSLFKTLRGSEEWGVRILAGADRRPVASPASGRSYLQARKRLLDREGHPSPRAASEVRAALQTLSKFASKVRREVLPPPAEGRPFAIGASMLVKSGRRKDWKKLVGRVGTSVERQGHRLDLTGPRPPYHFAS